MVYIPYGRQDITKADIDAVVEVLKSDYLTQGPKVPLFEKLVGDYCNAGHSVAVNSATSALHIACLALGVKEGDIVWTSPITFVASANCAIYCGAKVDFVDIDPETYNLCPEKLSEKLEAASKNNTLPKVLIPVHMCGQSCDMEQIHQLSRKYGFHIIEDASHAIGGQYKGKNIGSCSYSDITVFSFHPVKIITTGEGGVAVTNNKEIARTMELLRSHGITRDQFEMTKRSDGPWFYEQIGLGFNYRMTDLQAALGISQFERLDKYVAVRNELARRYNNILEGLPVVTPKIHKKNYSAFHLYVIRILEESAGVKKKQVFKYLRKQGIGVNLHYIPVHTQPYYAQMGFTRGQFPEAERYYSEAISLPMYATLGRENQNKVVRELKKVINYEASCDPSKRR